MGIEDILKAAAQETLANQRAAAPPADPAPADGEERPETAETGEEQEPGTAAAEGEAAPPVLARLDGKEFRTQEELESYVNGRIRDKDRGASKLLEEKRRVEAELAKYKQAPAQPALTLEMIDAAQEKFLEKLIAKGNEQERLNSMSKDDRFTWEQKHQIDQAKAVITQEIAELRQEQQNFKQFIQEERAERQKKQLEELDNAQTDAAWNEIDSFAAKTPQFAALATPEAQQNQTINSMLDLAVGISRSTLVRDPDTGQLRRNLSADQALKVLYAGFKELEKLKITKLTATADKNKLGAVGGSKTAPRGAPPAEDDWDLLHTDPLEISRKIRSGKR